MCLSGAVVAFWSLTQEVAGSSPFAVMTNIFVTEFSVFSDTFREKSTMFSSYHIIASIFRWDFILHSFRVFSLNFNYFS